MSALLLDQTVAKKRDTTIRCDMDTAELLRQVAALRKQSIADYLASVVVPIAERDLYTEAEKITSKGKATKKPKP